MGFQGTNQVLQHAHLGISFAIVLGLSVYLGMEADKRFETAPWGVVLGLALGFSGGFWQLYRAVYSQPKGGGVPDEENGGSAAD